MRFLIRFLKYFAVALVLSVVGWLAFYWFVIAGQPASPAADQYDTRVAHIFGQWFGYLIFICLLLAALVKETTFSLTVHDQNTFCYRLHGELEKLGYRLKRRTENGLIYKPPPLTLHAQKIRIKFGPDSANISGPPGPLEKLRQKL